MSDLTETYKAISPAEFFYKYREIAGFSNPARAMYQTIRELVENALDATDAHGILPDVRISITRVDESHDFYRITVEDNGIGIPPNVVPSAFGRVLFGSKYVMRQTRGMFGLGIKMVVLYAQMTTGQPVEVITSKRDFRRTYYFKLKIDIGKNEPVVLEACSWRKAKKWHGTIVSVTIEGDWNRAKLRILEYVQRTAIALPYVSMVLVTPEDETLYYPRTINKVPRPPIETKPHPLGIDLELLASIMRSGYSTVHEALINGLQGVGKITASRLVELSGVDPSKKPEELSQEELLKLLNVIKSYNKYKPPSPKALSPLGEEVIKTGLKIFFDAEFAEAVTRKPSSYGGHPFIVEAGIAYGGGVPISEEYPLILRYANKIPLLYDEGSDVITQVAKDEVDWQNYLVTFPAPIVLMVHVCSTKVPFKGVGKESIADIPELHREIRTAIQEVARKLRLYLAKKLREEEAKKRVEMIAKYIPEIARSLTVILGQGSSNPHINVELRNKLVENLVEIISKKTGISRDLILRVVKSVEIET
ncbi:MAG: DNA topoisomerase VI subunit B [Desulfurococcaceae archaeon]